MKLKRTKRGGALPMGMESMKRQELQQVRDEMATNRARWTTRRWKLEIKARGLLVERSLIRAEIRHIEMFVLQKLNDIEKRLATIDAQYRSALESIRKVPEPPMVATIVGDHRRLKRKRAHYDQIRHDPREALNLEHDEALQAGKQAEEPAQARSPAPRETAHENAT
jgi:hypothetical protein